MSVSRSPRARQGREFVLLPPLFEHLLVQLVPLPEQVIPVAPELLVLVDEELGRALEVGEAVGGLPPDLGDLLLRRALGLVRPLLRLHPVRVLVAGQLRLVLENPDRLAQLVQDARQHRQLVLPHSRVREQLAALGVGDSVGVDFQPRLLADRGVELLDPLVGGAAAFPAPLQPELPHVLTVARVERFHLLTAVEEVRGGEPPRSGDRHHVGVDVGRALVQVQHRLGAEAAVAPVAEELQGLADEALHLLLGDLAVPALEELVRGRKQQLDGLDGVAAGLAPVLVDDLPDPLAGVALVADEDAVEVRAPGVGVGDLSPAVVVAAGGADRPALLFRDADGAVGHARGNS